LRRAGSDYLAYAILDTLIDGYFPVLEKVERALEAIEDEVLARPRQVVIKHLNVVRSALMDMRRAVTPQREAINTLIRDDIPLVDPQVRIYFRDIYDHCIHLSETIDSSRELVSGLLNTYLTLQGNRLNEVMKVLTIVATIFVPLTFVAGIYGMNFDYMPELHERWAYPGLLAVMLFSSLLMLLYFRHKGWIGH